MFVIVLLIFLLLFNPFVWERFAGFFPDRSAATSNQPCGHGNDFPQDNFSCGYFVIGDEALDPQNVQTGGAFDARTAGAVEIAAAVGVGSLVMAFGKVEDHGGGCTIQRILGRELPRPPLQNRMNPGHKAKSLLINLQLFVVE